VSDHLRTHFDGLFDQLHSLRNAVESLRKEEQNHSLRGHQTVDSSESIQLSFQKLQAAIKEMEDTLLMIAEATGETGKL
jgi:ABC-type phosphate transport system auxiliary subunit